MVTDHAQTTGVSADDPFHFDVHPMPHAGVRVPVGVHRAVGGPHDAPTPGDLLCAALAACQDSTFRMIANIMNIELEELTVHVTGQVDVRGTLLIEPSVHIGFQSMRTEVRYRAKAGTSKDQLATLEKLAVRCCIVRQTLKGGVPIETTFGNATPAE
jgi:uncharacterized OsmC-like protein